MSDRPLVVSDDVRSELQARASSAERASRPRWLVWAGAVAVGVAVVFTAVKLVQRTSRAAELDRELSQAREIARKIGELTAANQLETALGGADALTADARMLGKISQAARDAGLTIATESEGDDTRPGAPRIKRKMYSFSFSGQPAEALMNWLKKVTTDLPGVQVKRVEIRPAEATSDGKAGWKLDVVLTRWEKQAS